MIFAEPFKEFANGTFGSDKNSCDCYGRQIVFLTQVGETFMCLFKFSSAKILYTRSYPFQKKNS
jgi:hypothetical protein